jgi:hypothetical protein
VAICIRTTDVDINRRQVLIRDVLSTLICDVRLIKCDIGGRTAGEPLSTVSMRRFDRLQRTIDALFPRRGGGGRYAGEFTPVMIDGDA